MGQHKLWKGIILGAAAGGAIMLIDKETRQSVGTRSKAAGSKCKGYMRNPSEAIHSFRLNYEKMSNRVNNGVEDLLDLLKKVEDMLNKVGEINQEVKQQLKAVDDSKEAS